MDTEIEVSVICLSYNHERYINQAIDSVLMQETNFTFEILVGNDCSTDGTKDILDSYEKRRIPNLFIFNREKFRKLIQRGKNDALIPTDKHGFLQYSKQ